MHYQRITRFGTLDRKKMPNRLYRHHPLLSTYDAMVQRCTNIKASGYKNYGGRGIKVSDRWLGSNGLTNFVKDMGDRPKGHSLDRVNNGGDYEPSNCRWADTTVQAINKRIRKDNKSGAVGVWYHKESNRWHAYIKYGGKRMRLGQYLERSEAIKARESAYNEYYKPLMETS